MRYLSKATSRAFRNKRVLLRVDFNIENPRDPADLFRLNATLPTVKKLLKYGARIIVMSHRGRPSPTKRGNHKRLSLCPFIPILERKLKQKVGFMPMLPCTVASRGGKIFLLENLRFWKGEEKNDPSFARAIAALGDVYVNDAFAVSHRKNASVVAITKFLPSYAGLLLEKEINNLDRVRRVVRRPFTLVIAGAKTDDKIGVLEYFSKRADWIMLGGGPANTFLKSAGVPIGSSVYDPKLVSLARKMLKNKNIVLPADFREKNGKMLDIGPYTEKKFSEIIRSSKMVFWNGPVGQFEVKKFAKGTKSIWHAILKNRKAHVVIGGGETVASAKLISNFEFRISNLRNVFISTGGGAMLAYLAGEKLPGIEVLKKYQ